MKKKIAGAIMFFFVLMGGVVIPASQAFAAPVIDTTDYNDYEARLQDCGIMGSSNLTACLVEALYYLVLTPSAWFARVTGELFDYFVQYSLDTNSYRGNDNFIERGWSIVRDIGNILFIFALLYIAITHILQAGTSGTKKFLINLIIAALLINFSLFFSRVIIDGGNVLARAFYNNIEIPNDDNLQYHTISQGIVMHVNPQRLLGSELFTPKYSSDPDVPAGKVDNGYAALILGMAAAVNIVMGITFLSVALLFVGRVVGLWFLMIFSPFALASIAVPNSGKIFGQFSWSGWIDQVLKLSFMAPVFMFFLFLLIMFLQVIFNTNVSDADKTTVQWLLDVIIPFVMVIFILNKAKKIAAEMAGEAGSAVKSAFGSAANYALGTTGLIAGGLMTGAAYVGRNTIGVAASDRLRSGVNQKNVRQYSLRAEQYAQKARQATTEKERKEAEAEAGKSRTRAAFYASKVKRDAYLKNKATFDIRKSTLLKSATGSVAGKNIGEQLGNLSKEFAGDKLKMSFGKGNETTQGKYEKEQEKSRLETAQLYSKDGSIEGIAGAEVMKNLIEVSKEGVAGKDKMLEHIDQYIREIKEADTLSAKEKAQRITDAAEWRSRVSDADTDEKIKDALKTREITRRVVNENGQVVNQKVTINAPKVNAYSEREGYADQTLNSTLVNLRLSESARDALVSKIRKGDKPGGIENDLKKWLKEQEDGDKGGKKDDKDDKSKPSAPPPPSGGGGGAHT